MEKGRRYATVESIMIMTERTKKIVITLLVAGCVVVAQLGLLDSVGQRYTDDGFKRALITFGIARGLNGVISVAQGTEVAVEPAGVGVIFTPGQILDPINDLIERFSWIMLASTTSLGLQGLLLKIFSSLHFSLLVIGSLVLSVGLMWWHKPLPRPVRLFTYRAAILLLILRFLVPMMAISSEGFYKLFLEAEYLKSSMELTQTRETIGRINEGEKLVEPERPPLTWYENLFHSYESTLDAMNVDKRVDALIRVVENVTDHTVNLIVIFTMQTIIFPLLFLWLSVRFFKAVIRGEGH